MNPLPVSLLRIPLAFAMLSACALAQQATPAPVGIPVFMKDGKSVLARNLRRQGDTLMVTQEMPATKMPPGQPQPPPTIGDVGYRISDIKNIAFPEPPALKQASDLLGLSRADDALKTLEPTAKYYDTLTDAPGSWWPDVNLLKAQALLRLGRDKEAQALADVLTRVSTNPEIRLGGYCIFAAISSRKGQFAAAVEEFNKIQAKSTRDDTLALAAIYKGECLLAQKEFESALLSFLQIPVFYPDNKMHKIASLLGAGRAYFGLDDLQRARETFQQLIQSHGSSPEAAMAKAEMEKVAQREKALEAPAPATAPTAPQSPDPSQPVK